MKEGFFSNLPLFPEQASNFAPRVDTLFFAVLGVIIFFATLILLFILYFIVRYRKGSKAPRGGQLSHRQQVLLEIGWSVVPLVISLGIFGWSAALYQDIFTPPENASDVYVVGKQWMWKLQHSSGKREINELHVPIGRPVRLVMTSQDVIHSFFVPAFRTKMDVLPNRYTESWFTPTRAGRYHLFCAEFCGTQHSGMKGWVYVMEPTDFERWLAGASAEGTMAERGKDHFTRLGCATCHGDGPSSRGPSLAGLIGSSVRLQGGRAIRADESYVRESILDPRAKLVAGYEPLMPTFKNQVSEDQIIELISYIKSLAADR
jgi:cytochrome c oxidase subunit II